MDRFERGLADPQEAKVVSECMYCSGEIYEGQTYTKAGDEPYCNMKCYAESIGAVTITAGEE